MTEENKKVNIREELERARQAGEAANLLYESSYIPDAISRLYYRLFHTVRALLLSKGLQPKTHEGCLTLFSLHFVKEGSFEPEKAHILSRLMKYREEADYNPSYTFTERDYREFRKDVEVLCDEISRYLTKRRYI